MKNRQRFGKARAQAGFSLVEVSLAIAICAIGLVALVGLLPAGAAASRRAADDTLVAGLANDALHWRRASPYADETYFPYGGPSLSSVGSITTILDATGNLPNYENGAADPFYSGSYFKLTESIITNPLANSADTKRVVITIQWPMQGGSSTALASNISTRVFVSDYGRMQ